MAQKNFLIIDPHGNTIQIPQDDANMRGILARLKPGEVTVHEDKRELWQYITAYMKGVNNENC